MLTCTISLDDQIDQAIQGNPHLAGRRLRFQAEFDEVTLDGTVGSYFQKQMAQETVLRIDGVRRIVNRLRVI